MKDRKVRNNIYEEKTRGRTNYLIILKIVLKVVKLFLYRIWSNKTAKYVVIILIQKLNEIDLFHSSVYAIFKPKRVNGSITKALLCLSNVSKACAILN